MIADWLISREPSGVVSEPAPARDLFWEFASAEFDCERFSRRDSGKGPSAYGQFRKLRLPSINCSQVPAPHSCDPIGNQQL
jgi:hypothetical protein